MRRFLGLFLIITMLVPLASAQEEPIPPRRTKAPKVGLFAGYTPGMLFFDVAPINEFLSGTGAAPMNDEAMFMQGGAGALYILVVPNVRVGFMAMGGSRTSTTVNADTKIRQDVDVNISFGGFTFEYVWTIVPKLDVAVGTMIGWGGMDLTLRKQLPGEGATWDGEKGVFTDWNNASVNGMTTLTRDMSGSFFTLIPALNVEYAISGWIGVRLGASYVAMMAPSWSLDGDYDLAGVPSSVKGNGLMLQAGIFVGTF
jgi:hypothetical protein